MERLTTIITSDNKHGKPENHRNTFSEFHERDTNTQMGSFFFSILAKRNQLRLTKTYTNKQRDF